MGTPKAIIPRFRPIAAKSGSPDLNRGPLVLAPILDRVGGPTHGPIGLAEFGDVGACSGQLSRVGHQLTQGSLGGGPIGRIVISQCGRRVGMTERSCCDRCRDAGVGELVARTVH